MRAPLVFTLIACCCCSLLSAEPPKITVSKETTYLTEPLGPDGLPDYRRAWLERLRKHKVPADQNGAVDYWQTVGLEMVDEQDRQAFCDELGMPMPPAEGVLERIDGPAVLRAMSIWYLRQRGYDVDDANFDAFEQQNAAAAWEAQFWPEAVDSYSTRLSYPAGEVPPLKEWLDRNSTKLDQIVAALHKPGWYDPPPTLCTDAHDSELDLGFRPLEWRGVSEALATRARISLAHGDLEAAVSDLIVIHRFEQLRDPELWIDIAVRRIGSVFEGSSVELLAMEHSQVTDQQLQQLQAAHALTAPNSRVPQTVSGGERVFVLDYSIELLRKNPEALDWLGFLDEDPSAADRAKQLLDYPIDHDHFLRLANREFDLLAEALKTGGAREVCAALDKLDKQSLDDPNIDKPIEDLTPQQRAESLNCAMKRMEHTGADMIVTAEARMNTHDQLMHLALALGRYRLAEGEYPKSLDAVVPRFAAKIPVDAYGNESLGYRKTDDGFLLYSYGLNGTDDGGSNNDMDVLAGYAAGAYSDQVRQLLGDEVPGKGPLKGYVPAHSDDIVIRLPLIAVPLPGGED